MKVAVFGLGYVGCVTAACLASRGHSVLGTDVSSFKVQAINQGRSPIVEPGLEDLIGRMVHTGMLRATTRADEAVRHSDVALVCVGTPSNRNGSQDTSYIERVFEEIGEALRDRQDRYVVALRSTVLPGTTDGIALPILERASGKTIGREVGLCFNPEFMREGTSLKDFYEPPFTIIGAGDPASGRVLSSLYEGIEGLQGPLINTEIRTAEMVKYISNAFHALKVAFGNEIGNLCKSLGIDGQHAMDILCQDTKLSISPTYLRPGFAFGGSCLGKDLRAILYQAKMNDLYLPVLSAVLPSNDFQVRRAVDMVQETGKRRVGLLGLAFKANTDDLRESPHVTLAETLLGKGYQVRVLDEKVSLSRLYGANKTYIEQEIPHISSLMCSTVDELVQDSEVLIIGDRSEAAIDALAMAGEDVTIIDLVGLAQNIPAGSTVCYRGICW